jgi:hypothetical protein
MREPIFEELIRFRAPAGCQDAIREAARREHQSMAEFSRQALFDRLAAVGVELKTASRAHVKLRK